MQISLSQKLLVYSLRKVHVVTAQVSYDLISYIISPAVEIFTTLFNGDQQLHALNCLFCLFVSSVFVLRYEYWFSFELIPWYGFIWNGTNAWHL